MERELKLRYAKSLALWERSGATLVPGSSTIVKHPDLHTYGAYPIFIARGAGGKVWDVDGNEYVDMQSGLGAVILGLCDPEVDAAATAQIGEGALFGLLSPKLAELSAAISRLAPGAEKMRFLKSGADAASAAVRIARAYTGREKVASCHFHGWHDWFYVTTNLARGIPRSQADFIREFSYNDLDSLRAIFEREPGQIAAVIMEPCCLEAPAPGYLAAVRELAAAHGALLIFDEVVTGFRMALGGGQELYGVIPDLSCFAKALGNGYSIAAVGGSREVMDKTGDVITSLTFAEDNIAAAAALACLSKLERDALLPQIKAKGEKLLGGLKSIFAEYPCGVSANGFPERFALEFAGFTGRPRLEMKALFLQETARRGVLFGHNNFPVAAHSAADIEACLGAVGEIARGFASGRLPERLGSLPRELW